MKKRSLSKSRHAKPDRIRQSGSDANGMSWLRRRTLIKAIDFSSPTFFMAVGMIGLMPGVVTNWHLWWVAIPGGENFGWSSFNLGGADTISFAHAWRAIFALMAIALIGLWPRGEMYKLRWVFVLPLFLAAVHPSDRMGAHIDYERVYNAEKLFATAVDHNELIQLEQSQGRLFGIVDWLPPWLANTGWLWARFDLARVAQSQSAGQPEALDPRIKEIEEEIVRLDQLQNPTSFMNDFGALQDYLAQKQLLPSLKEELRRLKAERAGMRRENAVLAEKAKPLVVEYAASLDTHRRWVADKEQKLLMFPYLLASAVSVWVFLFRVGIQNRYFVLASGSWFIGGGVNSFSVWGTTPLFWGIATFYPFLVFILICVAIRFLMRIWLDNRDLYAFISKVRRKGFWRKSVILTLPFLVLSFGLVYAGNRASDAVWSRIYCNAADVSTCVTFLDIAIYNSDFGRDTRRDDLHITLATALSKIEKQLAQSAAIAGSGVEDAIDKAAKDAKSNFDEVFLEPIWMYGSVAGPEKWIRWSGIFPKIDLKQLAYNIAVRSMNSAYVRQVHKLENWFNRQVDKISNTASSVAGTAVGRFTTGISGMAGPLAREARKGIDASLIIWAFFGLIGSATMLMVCGRAFSTIQGRLFSRYCPGRVATVVPGEAKALGDAGKYIDSKAGQLKVQAKQARDMLVKNGFGLDNATTETNILPSFFRHFPIRRSLSRTYRLKGVRPNRKDTTVGFSIAGNREFVRINLGENGAVSFLWKDFVAGSRSLSFHRMVTMRMTCVAMGYITRPVAKGPGTLILQTRGKPILNRKGSPQPSVEPYRIVVFSLSSRFKIHSGEKTWSVYFDESAFSPGAEARYAFDVDDERYRSRGVIRQLLRLVLP